MMISLSITVYTTENGGDAFQVHAADSRDPANLRDVTDQYELVAMQTDDGKEGFAVLKPSPSLSIQNEAERNMNGVEL